MGAPPDLGPAERTLFPGLGESVVSWRGALIVSALLLLATGAEAALPQPPCGAAAAPAYPAPGAAPVIAIWQEKELIDSNWHPPGCTGWPSDSRSKLVVTLAGSFRFDGPMNQLLA